MRKDATFAQPATPTTGLAAYHVDGMRQFTPGAGGEGGDWTARYGRRIAARIDGGAKITPHTSEVFNDLHAADGRLGLPDGFRAITEVDVADPGTITDVLAALEQAAPDWRVQPDSFAVVAVPRTSIVALQAGVKRAKVDAIASKMRNGAFTEGKAPVGVRLGGKVYIRDGHHRAIAALANGARSVDMRVIDAGAGLAKGHGRNANWTDGRAGGGGFGGGAVRGAPRGAAASAHSLMSSGTHDTAVRVRQSLGAHSAALIANQVPGKAVAGAAIGTALGGPAGGVAAAAGIEAASLGLTGVLAARVKRRAEALAYLHRRETRGPQAGRTENRLNIKAGPVNNRLVTTDRTDVPAAGPRPPLNIHATVRPDVHGFGGLHGSAGADAKIAAQRVNAKIAAHRAQQQATRESATTALVGRGRSKDVYAHPSDPKKVVVRMKRHAATEAFLDFAAQAHAAKSPMARHLPNPGERRIEGDHVTFETDKLTPTKDRVRIGRDERGLYLTGLATDHPQHRSLLDTANALDAHLKAVLPEGSAHYLDLSPQNFMVGLGGKIVINDPVEGGPAVAPLRSVQAFTPKAPRAPRAPRPATKKLATPAPRTAKPRTPRAPKAPASPAARTAATRGVAAAQRNAMPREPSAPVATGRPTRFERGPGGDTYHWTSGAGGAENTALTISPAGGVHIAYRNRATGTGTGVEARQVFGTALEALRDHARSHGLQRYQWHAEETQSAALAAPQKMRGLGDFYERQLTRHPVPGYTLARDGDTFTLTREPRAAATQTRRRPRVATEQRSTP